MASDEEQRYAELARLIEQHYIQAQAQGKGSEFTEVLSAAFQQAITEGGEALAAELKRTAPDMLAERHAMLATFHAQLRKRWGAALDLYEAVLVVAQEAGSGFVTQHVSEACRNADTKLWVLVRLHARAYQTASEVLALLNAGFATAAMARWRTIHEVAAAMQLISKSKGNDLAQRYLDREAIEAATAAREYQDHHVKLGYEPLDPAVYQALQTRKDELKRQYGTDFATDAYRWANEHVGKRMTKFEALEAEVGLEHMRPYNRLAGYGIHAHAKGILFHLEELRTGDPIAMGASDFGLADPGHATLISLLQCTTALLFTKPDQDALVTTIAMSRMVDEAGATFLQAHQECVRLYRTGEDG
ncbi:MAG TPA: DUF5677 domain-containing protein [Ktedonobacterales bacterium]|nr:DUF5677 domain-containing protein [Ktedonobacterales bacterium]